MNSVRPLAHTLIRFDKWSWYFFIVWFAASLTLQLAGSPMARTVAFWGIVLVLSNNLVRLILVSRQFKRAAQPRLTALTYVVIAMLLMAIGVQFLIR